MTRVRWFLVIEKEVCTDANLKQALIFLGYVSLNPQHSPVEAAEIMWGGFDCSTSDLIAKSFTDVVAGKGIS